MTIDFSSFRDRIREAILDKDRDFPLNTKEFEDLLTRLNIFRSSPFPGDFLILTMDESELGKLDLISITEHLDKKIPTELHTHNRLYVSGKFEVLERYVYHPANEKEALDFYRGLSEKGQCVFIITNIGTAYFYQGKQKLAQTNNIFFTATEMKKYSKKRDISEVLLVLDDYKKFLKYRYVYSRFFVPKSTLRRLYGEEKKEYLPNRNLLRNRPELIFRDDLKAFLTEHISGTFHITKEEELETMRRLDINITDENGDYFFFEIKWIGVSIGSDDLAAKTSYNSDGLKAGINQTARYIKELIEEKKTVKVGYLIVFDAREAKTEYDLVPFDYIDDGLDDYVCFISPQPDFYLDNARPR